MSSFVDTAITEHRISLLDAGLAHRSYCYISDIGAMMWRILLMGKDVIYNVGGDYRTTIVELAKSIGGIMNVEVVVPQDNAESLLGASMEVSVSISKFKAEFGSLPQVNPELGLQRTVNWHRAISGITASV